MIDMLDRQKKIIFWKFAIKKKLGQVNYFKGNVFCLAEQGILVNSLIEFWLEQT